MTNLYWQLSTAQLTEMRLAKEARLGKLDARQTTLTAREQIERGILLNQVDRIDHELTRRNGAHS
jgi:hypothetical protein